MALPLAVLSQTTTVPVETPQPTPTDTEPVPLAVGDIVAQAMEQIITPEEWQRLTEATPEECGQLE